MVLNFINKGKLLIAVLSGELDHHSAESVRLKLDNKLEELGEVNLVFDFSGVNFMDSSGLGAVIGRYKKISEYGGKVGIINLKPEIKRIFEMGGLFRIIKEYKSAEDALKNF
jgi:stage II sporulation protein AA (anti-sigma F factor antagonist)